jgi:DNA helicase-2/ATP-dependent DNA helicase PcrA
MYIPEEEKQYLAYALEKVQEELDKHDTDQEVITRDLYEKRKYLWQELVGAERAIQDQYERTMQETDIIAGEKSLSENQLQVERLKKMLDSPYFARIDFQEEDEYDSETFYIGKFGLTDLEFFEQIICDWRSDVASVYYNYEPGPAAYQCPNGEIPGELKSKRQFQIERGEMLGCFDTSVSIGDRFLQRILSGHAGEQMKTIVDSIQQKQNEIIRDTDHSVVVLNGCAGSGKTSIALHRIAYLMYHARNTLSAADCIIFSPNSLFEDYIASVLPDLGEDKVWQTTFADFATGVLGDSMKFVRSSKRYRMTANSISVPREAKSLPDASGPVWKSWKRPSDLRMCILRAS